MSTFQDMVKSFNIYDMDSDGVPEIESLQFLSFENSFEPVGIFQKFVIVLVEARLLGTIPGSRYATADLLQRLQRLKGDLLAEGYQARFLEMKVYAGAVHQDGKTLLAIREFFKQVRSIFTGFSGAILVGSFPESMIVRTWPDWRTLEQPERIKELGKTYPPGTRVYNIGLGIHAYRSEIVLSDLNGNWRNLYYQQHPDMHGCVFVPSTEQALPDDKVLLTCATGDYAISRNSYQDFFWIKDDQWQEISRTQSELQVIITRKLQDPELNAADRNQPNPITRPEISISRINAKNIAVSPDARLLDANGKPRTLQTLDAIGTNLLHWIHNPDLERTLLVDYFDRNHAFRSGRYSADPLRVSKITYDLGLFAVDEGLNGIDVPESDREVVSDASLIDLVRWLKKGSIIRGVGTHASDTGSNFRANADHAALEAEAGGNPWCWVKRNGQYIPSLEGRSTADLYFYRTIWENKITQGLCPAFFLHGGCDVNTPKNADIVPYNNTLYGIGQNAECILFYANALGVISRSKMFWDGPSGFGAGFGRSDDATFGDGWVQHFQKESMDSRLAENRTDRKKSSFWSIIGDWTLRKSYLCEAKTAHFRLRYMYDSSAPMPHPDKTIQCNGETIGHCHANGSTDIFQDNTVYAVGVLPSVPLAIHTIAVWLEYFYRLFSRDPYHTRFVKGQSSAEITIGKGFFVSASAETITSMGIDMPATEQDIPGVCLKVLLMIDYARYGTWPDWIFPAFVSRVTLAQTPGPIFSSGYADFNSTLKPCQWMINYDSAWDAAGNKRILKTAIKKSLNPQMTTNLFIDFNKNRMKNVIVTIVGMTNQGDTIDVQVPMQPSSDHSYYYGSFEKSTFWRDPVGLHLKIAATRSWQNSILKALIADVMDSKPATIASVDEHSHANLSFLNIDNGMDENHSFIMGPYTLYAPTNTLDPDQFDSAQSNNSFETATHINLALADAPHKTGVLRKDERTYDNLNFHDRQDIDYYYVTFQCPSYDDTDQANRPRTGGTNQYWGITHNHLPPALACSVIPVDLHCMNLDVHKPDKTPYASDTRTTGLSIDSPTRTLGSKQCYFVLRNHDPLHQGAFAYSLKVSYSSAYDTVHIDTHAPGFTEGTFTQNRRFLDQLYDRIDKPRPPDYREELIQVEDAALFIKGFEEFLTDPQVIAAVSRRNNRKATAEGLHFIGYLAETFGRYADAERLYRKSADQFQKLHDNNGALNALETLKSHYGKTGNAAEIKKLAKEIGSLKKILNL